MLLDISRRLSPSRKEMLRQNFAPLLALIRVPLRRAFAMSYYKPQLRQIRAWARLHTESSNFYYQLTPENRDHLAWLISHITGEGHAVIMAYFDELENDEGLRSHITDALKSSGYGRDIRVEYGRRLGWYALIRVLKPRVVIETGIDHGVGSCVIASALLLNLNEGHPGRYFGTEIRTEAGQLFRAPYNSTGEILYGDSIESLERFDQPIDMFINDSDHSGEYEYREYQAIISKLSPHGVILGDNAHATDSLSRFSHESGRKFLFFSEKPARHWYPGAGIGISFSAEGHIPSTRRELT
jgi:predicted O-methyltransferase YrrM